MNRVLKVALLSGLAVTLASCSTVQGMLPFGLGKNNEPQATATEGQRISVLEFEQALVPSAALSGRDFFIPGPQAAEDQVHPGRDDGRPAGHLGQDRPVPGVVRADGDQSRQHGGAHNQPFPGEKRDGRIDQTDGKTGHGHQQQA